MYQVKRHSERCNHFRWQLILADAERMVKDTNDREKDIYTILRRHSTLRWRVVWENTRWVVVVLVKGINYTTQFFRKNLEQAQLSHSKKRACNTSRSILNDVIFGFASLRAITPFGQTCLPNARCMVQVLNEAIQLVPHESGNTFWRWQCSLLSKTGYLGCLEINFLLPKE